MSIRATWFAPVLVLLWMLAFSGDAQARETTASCYGYGDGLAGNFTASGRVFDPDELVTAHRWLPFGTVLYVTFSSGVTLPLEVVDRGPFIWDRELDVACGAMVAAGVAPGVYSVLVS